jgi:hypothetical protein
MTSTALYFARTLLRNAFDWLEACLKTAPLGVFKRTLNLGTLLCIPWATAAAAPTVPTPQTAIGRPAAKLAHFARSHAVSHRFGFTAGHKAEGEGPGSGHGPLVVWPVTNRNPEHPVMTGLPAELPHDPDAFYGMSRSPCR